MLCISYYYLLWSGAGCFRFLYAYEVQQLFAVSSECLHIDRPPEYFCFFISPEGRDCGNKLLPFPGEKFADDLRYVVAQSAMMKRERGVYR